MRDLARLATALARLDVDEVARGAMGRAGAAISDEVRGRLSTEPGGPHTAPWLQSGALRDSVGHTSDAGQAVIGTTGIVAVVQEQGSPHDKPRPFLAPAAASAAPRVAGEVGAAFASALVAALGSRR